MHLNDKCDGVDLIELKPGKAQVIAGVYNERNPDNKIDYRVFEIRRMTETCQACPRVLTLSETEHYCLKPAKEDLR